MPVDRKSLNAFAVSIIDTLPAGGAPESYLTLSYEQAGLGTHRDGMMAVEFLVKGGLLKRQFERIVAGPMFDDTKAALAEARGEGGSK